MPRFQGGGRSAHAFLITLHFLLLKLEIKNQTSCFLSFKQRLDFYESIIFPFDVSACAAPDPILRFTNKLCAYRVIFDIPGTRKKIGFVHHVRGKPALPEMTAPAFPEIDESAITAMGLPNGEPDGILGLRNSYQMNMVGRQTIRSAGACFPVASCDGGTPGR